MQSDQDLALARAMRAAVAAMDCRMAVSKALEGLSDDLLVSNFDSVEYAKLRDSDMIAALGVPP